jgi:monovalent cation:proton antiporter-2 (CPA2) family protein
MTSELQFPYIREVVVFLITAAVLAPFFQRLKAPPMIAFLMAGVVIGPFGLGMFQDRIGVLRYAVITNVDQVKSLASLGVVFLLFMIGLELSLERIWSMRRLVFGLGAAQVLTTTVVIMLVMLALGSSVQASILLGACLALSSTAVVVHTLTERGEFTSVLGRDSFAVLLFQDLAVVPILFLAALFGGHSDKAGGVGVALAAAITSTLLAVLVILAVGRLVLRPLFRLATLRRSPEFFMATTLLVIIAAASSSAAAGLSMAVGGFLAGLLLAETEYRHQIGVDIEPFKGLLMGLFFLSIGMGIDMRAVIAYAPWLALGVVGLFVVKGSIVAVLALALGLSAETALPMGVLLGQGGEFAFVVISAATSDGVIRPDAAQFTVIVATLSMMLTPAMAALASRLRRWLAVRQAAKYAHEGLDEVRRMEGHVIIAGFGRVGQVIARFLQDFELSFIGLDLDGSRLPMLREAGFPVFYGDASRRDVLERLNAPRAAALVVTLDDPRAAARLVAIANEAWPTLPIYVRARDQRHVAALMASGATRVIPETAESSLQLGGVILSELGAPEEKIASMIEDVRRNDYQACSPV